MSGIRGRSARGVDDDVISESGNPGIQDENCFLNQAGMVGVSCKYFSSPLRLGLSKDQKIIALETVHVLGKR